MFSFCTMICCNIHSSNQNIIMLKWDAYQLVSYAMNFEMRKKKMKQDDDMGLLHGQLILISTLSSEKKIFPQNLTFQRLLPQNINVCSSSIFLWPSTKNCERYASVREAIFLRHSCYYIFPFTVNVECSDGGISSAGNIHLKYKMLFRFLAMHFACGNHLCYRLWHQL